MHAQTSEGEVAKEEGINRVIHNNQEWVGGAIESIIALASTGVPFTADHLRGLPPPPHPNCVGGAFRSASRDGIIRIVGYTRSQVNASRARVIARWIGTKS